MGILSTLIHRDLQIWIRRGVPKRRATFKDVLEGVQHQAVSAAMLLTVKPLWTLAEQQAIPVIFYFDALLICIYSLGASFSMVLSIYQTLYAVEQASFLNTPKHRRVKTWSYKIFLIAWLASLVGSLLYAGLVTVWVGKI
jgi:hypothetical protein